jgi:hypothetical protein
MEDQQTLALERDKANLARQYLLGTLRPDDAMLLEENFFVDDPTFEEIEIAEDELVDAYVRQELSENERLRFEQNLGQLPRVEERIKFARALVLTTVVGSQPTDATGLDSAESLSSNDLSKEEPATAENIFSVTPGETTRRGWRELLASWFVPQRVAALSAAMVLLVAMSFLFVDWLRLRRESQRLIAEREEVQRQKDAIAGRDENERRQLAQQAEAAEAQKATLMEELERLRSQTGAPQPAIALLLFPGGSRGSGSESDLHLPPNPTTVRLRLALESDNYPHYGAVVNDVDGVVITKKSNLNSSNYKSTKVVTLQLSSKALSKRGNYTVTLNGIRPPNPEEFVGSYSFRTTAQK